MSAILEDIEERHGGGGEAVNKQGLELALEKVQSDQGHGKRLERGGRSQAGVEQWMDDDGTKVLDQKDRAPWDLRSWVFRQRSENGMGQREKRGGGRMQGRAAGGGENGSGRLT